MSAERSFAVGDVVVYASHGIGTVEKTAPEGAEAELITVAFPTGLTVTLPRTRACIALRPLSTEAELKKVKLTLGTSDEAPAEAWARRHRRTQEKVSSGQVAALAEVVRDGVQHEQRRAATGSGTTAPSDRQLYLQARALLGAEIALCRGIEQTEADAWILAQVAEPVIAS